MMSNFKIIFIHGYTSSHLENWYPNIAKSLDELGIDYAIPDLPGHRHPHAEAWLEIIHREVQRSEKPVILFGHSLGSRAALLYLDQYKHQVKAVFLLAAFANRTENADQRNGEAYPDFFEYVIDLEALKKLCQQFVIIHSLDDDSIDYEQGEELAEQLGAKLVTPNGRQHMSDPNNAPYILSELRADLDF